MDIFTQIVTKIIKEQEIIIGPVAWNEASKVKGLHIVDKKTGEITIEQGSDSRLVVDDLVSKYRGLFGRAALEVSKEAVGSILADLAPADVPSSLR